MAKTKTATKNDPADNPCYGCTTCCEHVSLEIDKPESRKRFEEVIWFLLHKDVWLWVDGVDGAWHIQFDSGCRWLKEGLCSHYRRRPTICRNYSADECVRHEGDHYRHIFREPRDVLQYLKKSRKRIYAQMVQAGWGRLARSEKRVIKPQNN